MKRGLRTMRMSFRWAVTGYDLVTGWGSPTPGLINELAP